MIIKERTKSVSHRVLESLNARISLSLTEKNQYDNQIKGYEGEVQFDHKLIEASAPGIILNDLLLSTRNTCYQIDALLITDTKIYIYEVKNYSGSYFYKAGDILSESGHLLQNPVSQVERKRAFLHNHLLNTCFKIDIVPYVVYINPDFYIFDLPQHPAILFAGQLDRHLASISCKIEHSHLKLANTLLTQHDNFYRPTNLPNYSLKDLKKGILCKECLSFDYTTSRQLRTCTACGTQEKTADAIYRSVQEFRLLFPEVPVTKKRMYEWCGKDLPDYRIKRVLKKYFRLQASSRSSFYS